MKTEHIKRLEELGWIDEDLETPWGITVRESEIVRSYQRFHGLVVDGVIGPITERHMGLARICGWSDRMLPMRNGRSNKWGHQDVSYYISAPLPGMSIAETNAAANQACESWNKVCGLELHRVSNRNNANIVMDVGGIDGPGGTLAWSQLPPANPCQQKYDSRERGWRNLKRPGAYIDAVAVICHEVGHALGLDHSRSSQALMAPVYQPGLRVPQKNDDISRIQALYGQPETPSPVDPDNSTPAVEIRVKHDGKTWVAASHMRDAQNLEAASERLV